MFNLRCFNFQEEFHECETNEIMKSKKWVNEIEMKSEYTEIVINTIVLIGEYSVERKMY